MNIRNSEYYLNSFWDWGILDGCFGKTNIKPTDIDGAIERNGKYLFIETKLPGIPIPVGQSMFYEGQVNAGNSILFVWGEPDNPCKLRLVTPNRQRTYEPADLETFRLIVSQWFDWADKQPRFAYKGICNG